MKLSLGCIADDYTGASDLANTLTRCGLRTVQTIGVPSDDLVLPEGQYSVEDLGHWRVGLADVRRGRHDVGDGDSLATANRRRFGVD